MSGTNSHTQAAKPTHHPTWMASVRGGQRMLWADALLDERSLRRIERSVGLGFRVRAVIDGPEQNLVERFLERQQFVLPPGRRLTVFSQPAVETGYPDLVAVVWRPSVTSSWNEERLNLRPQDVQLLHLLSSSGWTDRAFLKTLFPREFERTVGRLEAADLVICRTKKCRARSLSQIFAVEQIVAVEAKVGWWRRAVEQARNNLWFSSESHVLLPEKRSFEALVAEVDASGIGVIGQLADDTSQHKEPEIQRVPASYGSWLFNEWVWRIAVHQEQI